MRAIVIDQSISGANLDLANAENESCQRLYDSLSLSISMGYLFPCLCIAHLTFLYVHASICTSLPL